MRLMIRARVAGERLTSTSPSHPARSCGSTPADVPVAYLGGLSPATRAQFDFRVSTRLKPGAIDLVPPTAAESLQARVRGAATHGVERSVAQGVRRECPNSRTFSPVRGGEGSRLTRATLPPLMILREY